MSLAKAFGQVEVKDLLRRLVAQERLPHAMLLLGPAGSGKLALAKGFAQYILCEDKAEDDACGQCNACLKASKNIHPDIHFSFPTVGTNVKSDSFLPQWRSALDDNPYMEVNDWLQIIGAENKQGNINKEECLNIIRKLSLKTFEGSHKVLIMWLPEYLGKEGNRLLKLIEEPPDQTVFILVAEQQELILNTILSRCQVVKIRALRDEEVKEALLEKKVANAENAEAISQLSDGNLNEALKMAQEKENDNAALFLEWMRKCYVGNGVEMVKWVDKFAKLGRENQKHFIRYALHFMREYMVLKMSSQTHVRLRNIELKTAQNLQKVIEFDQIEDIVQLLNDNAYYIERNANPKVLFLDTSIQLNKILKRKKTEARTAVN